jgi:hypothetical protein
MTVCETSSEQLIQHRPDHPDRSEWLGGEALVPVRPAKYRPGVLNIMLSPWALVIAFLAGAVIGGSATTLWAAAQRTIRTSQRRTAKYYRRG